jgi:hypothetical protein
MRLWLVPRALVNRLFLLTRNHAGKYAVVDLCKEISSSEIYSIHHPTMRRILDVDLTVHHSRPVEEKEPKKPGKQKKGSVEKDFSE